jgi:hypothetical protein
MVLGAVFRGSKSPAKSNGGIVIGVLRRSCYISEERALDLRVWIALDVFLDIYYIRSFPFILR